MENNDIFVRTLLTDKVKLRPSQISSKLKNHLLTSLQTKFEGLCSYHGFIRPQSIEIFKYSLGYIQALSLNGDVEYVVNYYADVCNPSIGSVVHTKVVNTNKFGILAHTGIKDENGKFMPIMEIVIARSMINAQNDRNVDDINIGEDVHVEILGKKFELTDKKIQAIARIMETDINKNILDGVDAAVNTVDGAEGEEDEDDHTDSSSEDSKEDEEEDDDEQKEQEQEPEDDEEEPEDDEDEPDDEDEEDASQLGGDLGSEGFFSDHDDAISDFGSDVGSDT